MGIFTSKIITGVIAGGFTLAGAGLLFTGTGTLNNATSFVKDAGARLAQYEQNEGTLVSKIGVIKADASTKLATANATIEKLDGQITTLSNEKATLQSTVNGLKASIADLNAELAAEQGDHAKTKAALEAKVKELETASANLAAANKKIADYEAAARVAVEKAKEADQHITKLEAEVQKANAEVAEHGRVVDEVKTNTSDDQPLSQADVDAIDTTVK